MELKRHIFFIGMMGTGKTTVGQKLAIQIGYPWADVDQQLEKKWGFSIAEYFQQFGEEAFREEESKMLQKLANQRTASVITTGGGIVLRQGNRNLMLRHGWIIHLTAHPDELVRRLKDDQTRPLLAGNLEEKIRTLMKERAELYQIADISIDTTDQTPQETLKEIERFLFKSSFSRSR